MSSCAALASWRSTLLAGVIINGGALLCGTKGGNSCNSANSPKGAELPKMAIAMAVRDKMLQRFSPQNPQPAHGSLDWPLEPLQGRRVAGTSATTACGGTAWRPCVARCGPARPSPGCRANALLGVFGQGGQGSLQGTCMFFFVIPEIAEGVGNTRTGRFRGKKLFLAPLDRHRWTQK